MLPPILLHLGILAAPADRADTRVAAKVAGDLETIDVRVTTDYLPVERIDAVTIVLAADRYKTLPAGLFSTNEHEIFPRGYAFGGFENVVAWIDGTPCAPSVSSLPDGATVLRCARSLERGESVTVEVRARLRVPERYGGFGRHGRQVTLAGGWYPQVARPGAAAPRGEHTVRVELPPSFGAVVGDRVFTGLAGQARTVEHRMRSRSMVPLVVLPPSVSVSATLGRSRLVTTHGSSVRDAEGGSSEGRELERTIREGVSFFIADGLLSPKEPADWLLVVAPLRHEIAIATEGMTLVSDRAFRMLPIERFFRFHRISVLRALFTSALLARFGARDGGGDSIRLRAEAAAAALADRFVRERFGRAEDAFDVLSFWSFIPAVDLLLYAPDVPFESVYFHRVDESDPLTPNFVDFPGADASGKVIFEKLLDRIGPEATERVLRRVSRGTKLDGAIEPELGAGTRAFLETWLGAYPRVQYRLASQRCTPAPAALCGRAPCFLAEVAIAREGEVISEPIEIRLRDEAGLDHLVWTRSTTAALRVLTTTMTAELDQVEIDPHGRLVETPTDEVPSPRLDNRSYRRTKVLVNNWNLSVAATQGTVDTALDLGFSREWDVRWRWAARLDLDPAAFGVSGRGSYAFGSSVTRARLSSVVGMSLESAFLRPKFGGARESAYAVGARVFVGYDDRASLWAAQSGLGVSAALDWAHVFGDLIEGVEGGASRRVSRDAVLVSARAVRSWRFGGEHLVSVRASAGSILVGEPRRQLLFRLGGRSNVRGFAADARLGAVRGIAGFEWLHPVIHELNESFLNLTWVSSLDGAFYGDAAVIADGLSALGSSRPVGDVGYGLRLYIDYLGVRPGVMAVDVAFPITGQGGRVQLGSPAVYVDFSHSF